MQYCKNEQANGFNEIIINNNCCNDLPEITEQNVNSYVERFNKFCMVFKEIKRNNEKHNEVA